MHPSSVLRVLPLAALFLAACGDGSVRSPDLPGETLSGIGPLNCSFPGAQNRLAVDQTGVCNLPSQCTYRGVDDQGQIRERQGGCPDGLVLSSSQPGVASVAADGTVTGVAPGTTQITAGGHGLTSPATTVTVTAACGTSLAITPATVTLVSGSSSGTSQRLTATLTLSDGTTVDVSTVTGTRWSSSDTAVMTFTGNQATARPGVAAATTVTATARYDGNVCAGSSELSANLAIAVRPAQVIASGGLCIETTPPSTAFTGCRADTGACPTPTAPIELSIGQSRQLLIRGRFDDGMECNITADATLGTGNAAIASVNTAAQLTGQGSGSTTATAAFGGRNSSRPVQVTVNQVLGNNSLAVFARAGFTDSQSISLADAQQRKFSCVGANNLLLDGLGNRTPRGALKAFAYAAGCPSSQLDGDGNCTADAGGGARSAAAFIANAATQNVSSQPPRAGSDPLNDGIVWRSVAGYWGMNPTTQALGCITETSNPSAHVGDVHVAGERRLAVGDDGLPIEAGSGPRGQLQANGLVYADAAVRVGFNCVTATYSNPEDPADTQTDGMTVLVLPAVNDILLSGSNDGYALCESLAPLFGSEPLLRLVETTSVLSRVTAQLSPLLEQLDAVPIDSLLTTLQTDILSPVTGPLIDALDEYVIDPVLEPVVCQVGTAVNRLLALLTNTEPTQACPTP